QLDIKHLLPFRLNGSSPLTVINHTFGVPQPLKKKQIISCNICHLRFNSTVRRKNKLMSVERAPQPDLKPVTLDAKMDESAKSLVMLTPESEASTSELVTLSPPQISPSYPLSETASDTSAADGPEAEEAAGQSSQGETTKSHLHCPVCKVTVNSASQLEAHNSGTKHKLTLEGQSVLPRRRGKVVAARAGCKSKRLGSKGSVGVTSKNFQCEVCEIFVNSETQLSQHMNSRRHKDRLAGKPPKPKFTPHSKSQPSSSLAVRRRRTKLALQKQLTKTLSTSGFLHSPLSPPPGLCTVAATNPLALRHPMGTAAAFIQTPFLSPALFRPAPGPLRATHTPIIFSPY
uniref:Zinc finger protein 385C n=1 Tax=Neogobius melanostomus TaxID=47308 RepID=A0A8C6SEH9_9GOBI